MKKSRKCCVCKSALVGKMSQRYCTKDCQNTYERIKYNFLYHILSKDNINKRVKRNYVILHAIFSNSGKEIRIHKNNLFEFGYDTKAFLDKRKSNKKDVFIIEEFEIKDEGNGIIHIKRTKKCNTYPKEFVDRWAFEFDVEHGEIVGRKLRLLVNFYEVIFHLEKRIPVARAKYIKGFESFYIHPT